MNRKLSLVLVLVALTGPAGPCLAEATQGFYIAPHLNNVTRDGVTLIWETHLPDQGIVEYGRGGDYSQRAAGPAESKIHRVRATGLAAETEYNYRVRAGDEVHEAAFKTAPAADRPITFAVVGDSRRWGDRWEATAMARHLEQWNPEFLINTGDLVVSGHDYKLWPEHFNRFGSLISRLMMVTSRGNHEGSQISDRENDWFAKYHELPGAGEPYASFDWGNTHIVVVSFEQIPGAPKFLDEHLPSVDKPHTVVIQHMPVYCTGYYSATDSRKDPGDTHMKPVAQALDRHGVVLDICGHTHIYERSHAIRDGKRAERNGCTYVVNGGDIGGNFPEWFTAVIDDRNTMEKPTYTVFHMGEDRIWFRTFAWSKAENQPIEIDYRVLWKDEALPKTALGALEGLDGDPLAAAIKELGAMAYPPAGKALRLYLDHQALAVRQAAAAALRECGTVELSPELLEYLGDSDPMVRQSISRAIEIAMSPAACQAAAQHVLDAAQHLQVRINLMGGLRLHGPATLATETAISLLKIPETPQPLRERAAYALASTATAEDVPALAELFRNEAAEYVTLRLAFTLNAITGRRQPVDAKTPIGRSKPGEEREAFIQKWLEGLQKKAA
jgi:hypothetical protein